MHTGRIFLCHTNQCRLSRGQKHNRNFKGRSEGRFNLLWPRWFSYRNDLVFPHTVREKMRNLALLLTLLLLSFVGISAAHAQSLDQLAQQLQEKPSDTALREQVIKQAQEESATVPEEARRAFVQGTAIAKNAKDK